jgi:hypothetical protein
VGGSLFGGEVPCQLLDNVGKGDGFAPSIGFLKVKHNEVVLLPQRSIPWRVGGPAETAQPSTLEAARSG